jgi:NAD(P)-dependent dehydrogenase (short-subunit alcohol dehydrogenase family)
VADPASSDLASTRALAGRTALVTGGSRGIGLAIAQGLSDAGAAVVLAGRDRASLLEAAATFPAGRAIHAVEMDVMSVASIRNGVLAAREAAGPIHCLVNNAGVEEVRPSLEVDEGLWNRIVDTNLKGAFFCAQAVARQLAGDGRRGAILNILSLTSEVGVPTATPYGASKSGLLGVTRALAAEWAPLGIRVNGVAPGYFRTALTEPFYQDEAWANRMLGRIPMARFGALDDLVGASVFLLSDASAYVTGVCLPVDGGFLASI